MKKNISVILIGVFSLLTSYCFAATYSVCSSGCNYTTIQGAFNGENLEPDDILEIQDSGTYTENVAWGSDDGGSSDNRVILRAETGETPTVAGHIWGNGVNYIQIGDIGHGVITVDPTTTGWLDGAIDLTSSDYSYVENCTVTDVYDGNGIILYNSDYCVVQYNTVHDIATSHHGDGTQGEGIIIYLAGTHNTINNNSVSAAAHSQITIIGNGNATAYNQVLNNYINTGYGEHISFLGTNYCLADGNRCYNIATEQTGLPKPAIQLTSSSNCSIRRNIIYNGHHYYAFEMFGYSANYVTNNNWIYNNTIHTWGTSSSASGGGSAVVLGAGGVGCEAAGNKFYNNIFWDVNHTGQSGWYDGSHKLCFYAYYSGAPNASDWGCSEAAMESSNLQDNEFKNNVIYVNAGGTRYAMAYICYDDSYVYEEDYADFNADFTNASGNINSDPTFSANPSGNLGANDTWWHIQPGSPCIDTGTAVNDANASTGGWSQLTYSGSAPDIGALEIDSEQSMSLNGTLTIPGSQTLTIQ